jgi:hypothetical protein
MKRFVTFIEKDIPPADTGVAILYTTVVTLVIFGVIMCLVI